MQKRDRQIKIVIASGGTGGHLFPAQALALDLLQRETEVEIVFMSSGLSKNPYFPKEDFAYREVSSATPYKKKSLDLFKSCYFLIKGTLQSLRHLHNIRPKAVIGFGSFHSFPVLLAAKLKRVPIILFESNAVPGKVNRFCSRWAKISAVHFLNAAKYLKGETISVQMPLLKKGRGISPQKAREYFKLDRDRLTLLVFGGSQGAQAINHLFCASLEQLLSKNFSFQVVHIVGNPKRVERLQEIYAKYQIPAAVKQFEEKMDFAWSAADLSISRAGAATLAEQIEFAIPSILVPYPHATENHQGRNATFIAEEIRGAVKLNESDLSSQHLVSTIEELLHSQGKKLKMMKQSLEDFKSTENKRDLCSVILEQLQLL